MRVIPRDFRTPPRRVLCAASVERRRPSRAFGVLPDSGSETTSDWGLSRHTVDLGGQSAIETAMKVSGVGLTTFVM